MIKNQKIEVQGVAISVLKYETDDYISLTDIARHKMQSIQTPLSRIG